MRRNVVRLLRYLIVAALFLTLGPVTVKLMFEDHHDQHLESRRHLRREPVEAHGLPVDPDDLRAIRYSPVSADSLFNAVLLTDNTLVLSV